MQALKVKLVLYKYDQKIFDEEEDNNHISRFFLENSNAKDFYEEVVNIRKQINDLNDRIFELKAAQILLFKKKYENIKSSNMVQKSNISNDLAYSALFGNSTTI